jgi:hypothetical protein
MFLEPLIESRLATHEGTELMVARERLRAPSGAGANTHDMPHMWYKHGMARVRISTTVDEQLLATARRTRSELADAALIDEALSALLARNRAGEIDAAYAAYDRVPLDADDEWGNLASFRTAAGAS